MSKLKPIPSEQTDVDVVVDEAAAREGLRRYAEAISQAGVKDVDGKWSVRPGDLVAVVRWIEQVGTPDGSGGFVLPDSIQWDQLWAAAFSAGTDANGGDESGESFSFDLSGSDVPPIWLPKRAYRNAIRRHRTGTELYHVQRAYRMVRTVKGALTDFEVNARRCEHHVPAPAMHHLRQAAGLPLADSKGLDLELDELVTLSQVAPLAGRSKRTLERYLTNCDLPQPDIRGGNGKANKWYWRKLRPALEELSKRPLPERFPGSRIN